MTDDTNNNVDNDEQSDQLHERFANRLGDGASATREVVEDAAEYAREEWGPVVREGAERSRDRLGDVEWREHAGTAAPYAVKAVGGIIGLVSVYWILQWMWGAFGPISTIAYVVFFTIGAVGTPLFVILFGPSFPGLFKDLYGKLHWFLGALTYGNTVLVETDEGWEACPAADGAVYVDDEWQEIHGGWENKSTILGLPFAIARDKSSDDAYAHVRVDPKADAVSDGGVVQAPSHGNRERGGYQEAAPDVDVTGDDGVWLVDLVRVEGSGLVHAGDGELVEQAEMDKLQDEAKSSRMQGWKPVVGMIAGLLLGCGVGFTIMFAM